MIRFAYMRGERTQVLPQVSQNHNSLQILIIWLPVGCCDSGLPVVLRVRSIKLSEV